MKNLNIALNNRKKINVRYGTTLNDVINNNNLNENTNCILGRFNNKVYELSYKLQKDGFVDIVNPKEKISMLAYERTLKFILIKAIYDLYQDSKIYIEHSLSNGIFGEVIKDSPLNEEDIKLIKNKMNEIINKDIKINKIIVSKSEAIEIFKKYNMKNKMRMLNHLMEDRLTLYELDGRYDYFYGPMAISTGSIKIFDLIYYKPGFILFSPKGENPYIVPKFKEQRKLAKIFYESEKWGKILDVGHVGALNDKVESGEIVDLVRTVEALHEKKIAYIADMIKERENTKLVLISGPSSSGKTTFTKRLGIQLKVNGLIPIQISLDDYFVERDKTPKDKNGNYDFESIYALDLELFNKNLKSLLNGDETIIPKYDFITGRRKWHKEAIVLPKRGIVLIEGIHGLNEMLTSSILKENKFKIYISALTQLNLDNHNRISTTDVRMIRRIVRDYLSRGYNGEDTLKMWPSIKKGEEKNIFIYQEEADVMFNSSLIYELCVLKKYAQRELEKVNEDSLVYLEAKRLMDFLHFFKDIDIDLVPENSILREFIGGSCFYKY